MSAFLLKYPGASRNLGGVEWREEKKRGQEVFGVNYVCKLERGLMARLLIFFLQDFQSFLSAKYYFLLLVVKFLQHILKTF